MTPEQLESLWHLGQQREAEGSLDAAREAYLQILSGSPRQIMVQVRLSELEQRAGRYRAARDHAVQAARTLAHTQRWEGLAFVTANLMLFDERQAVVELITLADWNDPRVMTQSPVLSQQLWLCGNERAALHMLDGIAPRVGPDHRLAYSRAMALQQLGQISAATDAFEESIRIDPNFALAHWSLAYHENSSPPGTREARIRTALAQEAGELERAMLHYALYKELDAAGQYAAAWSALEEGAAIMRRMQPHSEAAFMADIDALLSAPPIPPVDVAGAHPQSPIFIVGMPRTGTTVLSRIIGAHPKVADAGELNALQHALNEKLDRFVDLPLRGADLNELGSESGGAIGDAYLRRTRALYEGAATHLIDKNPNNIFAAGIIAQAMPHAKILCMVRSPMDACFSGLRQLFQNGAFAYSYDQRQLAGHYAAFRRVVQHWEQRIPGNFLAISYEDLVSEPEVVGRTAMEFCGLDFDPAYTEITRNSSPSSTASNTQIREPIHAAGIGAWHRYEQQLKPLADRLQELSVSL